MDSLTILPPVVSLLPWNETESSNCEAQGIITNDTDHVWLSCKSYIAHGRLEFSSRASGVPVRLTLDAFNYNALQGPSQVTGVNYQHISDGDYFPATTARGDGDDDANNGTTTGATAAGAVGELWFGIEGGEWPRVTPGAIARYNAETLEFIGIHQHPYLRTMPWLVIDAKNQRAISCNWTDNVNEFNIFDAKTLSWLDQNITVTDVPVDFETTNGIPYIQGGAKIPAVLSNNQEFLLQVDDEKSTLLLVQLKGNDTMQVRHSWPTGLGHEREGVAMTGSHILSLGNRKSTVPWAAYPSTAQIVVIEALPGLVKTGIPFGFGILTGMLLVLFLRLLYCCCCRCCCRSGKNKLSRSEESEMTKLAADRSNEDGHEDELI